MKLREISLTLVTFILLSMNIHSERVISLSPAITEIIFELGLGDTIVGNTKFCNYPVESLSVTKIGGYLDINLEMIIELKPDIVFHYPEHELRLRALKDFTHLVQLSHHSINDLLSSIKKISAALRIKSKGEELTRNILDKLNKIKEKKKGIDKKKVLIVIGRDPDQLKNITIIGNGDFLNELLKIAGGENAYEGEILYPSVSIESIISMDPDLIIEFSFLENSPAEEFVRELWGKYPHIRAVTLGNIHIIRDDFWVRPGPRIGRIAELLYKMLLSE